MLLDRRDSFVHLSKKMSV
jgi:hypothetical protein